MRRFVAAVGAPVLVAAVLVPLVFVRMTVEGDGLILIDEGDHVPLILPFIEAAIVVVGGCVIAVAWVLAVRWCWRELRR